MELGLQQHKPSRAHPSKHSMCSALLNHSRTIHCCWHTPHHTNTLIPVLTGSSTVMVRDGLSTPAPPAPAPAAVAAALLPAPAAAAAPSGPPSLVAALGGAGVLKLLLVAASAVAVLACGTCLPAAAAAAALPAAPAAAAAAVAAVLPALRAAAAAARSSFWRCFSASSALQAARC